MNSTDDQLVDKKGIEFGSDVVCFSIIAEPSLHSFEEQKCILLRMASQKGNVDRGDHQREAGLLSDIIPGSQIQLLM